VTGEVSKLAVYAVIEKRVLQQHTFMFAVGLENLTVAAFNSPFNSDPIASAGVSASAGQSLRNLFRSAVSKACFVDEAAVNISSVVAFGTPPRSASSPTPHRANGRAMQDDGDNSGGNGWGVAVATTVLLPTNSSMQSLVGRLGDGGASSSSFMEDLARALTEEGWAEASGTDTLTGSSLAMQGYTGDGDGDEGSGDDGSGGKEGEQTTSTGDDTKSGSRAVGLVVALLLLLGLPALAMVILQRRKHRRRQGKAGSHTKDNALEAAARTTIGTQVIAENDAAHNPMTAMVSESGGDFGARNPFFRESGLDGTAHRALHGSGSNEAARPTESGMASSSITTTSGSSATL
jgi:hypothetical protein